MRRYWPIALGVLLLGLVIWFALGLARDGDQDRLSDDQLANRADENATSAGQGPDERCAAPATYDLMKRELFRQAANLRGSDSAVFDRLAAYAALRVEAPVVEQQDAGLDMVSCSARVSLDLPPGVAVVGGRRTLTASLSYAVQPAADGSGDVVTLRGADAITIPLATLAKEGGQSSAPTAPQVEPNSVPSDPLAPQPEPSPSPPVTAPPVSRPIEPSPPPAPRPERAETSARPSFNCARARTRGEMAVCRSPSLASLDREMASFYTRSYRNADSGQRSLLEQTRARFLGYRDRCGSDACIADAYRGRITEIRDIMDGRWSARP